MLPGTMPRLSGSGQPIGVVTITALFVIRFAVSPVEDHWVSFWVRVQMRTASALELSQGVGSGQRSCLAGKYFLLPQVTRYFPRLLSNDGFSPHCGQRFIAARVSSTRSSSGRLNSNELSGERVGPLAGAAAGFTGAEILRAGVACDALSAAVARRADLLCARIALVLVIVAVFISGSWLMGIFHGAVSLSASSRAWALRIRWP